MALFLEYNKENIKNNQNSTFNQKFSSLYQELNPSIEGLSIYFYPVYTARRLIFLIFQLFLDQNYIVQFAAHIVGSILCLIFYIKFTQLKEKSSQIILIASELTILITFFCIFFINFTENEDRLDCITSVLIYSVIGFIAFEGLIEIYKFYGFIKELRNHFKNKRKEKIIVGT